ncbi:MAG: hypothetical protein BWY92_01682 [Firmicutes bacterium ADurb.BinA052]|nr:MAG: hypothetical protein BWY92_01682 [Firmicutes bacterium ADurb.BinA052]
MALCTALNDAMFFSSTKVPNSFESRGITETLASHLMEPSSILQSDTPMATKMDRSLVRYARASSADRMSASDTISIRPIPERLKSSSDWLAEIMSSPACTSFAVSSSRCTRLTRIRLGCPSTSMSM